MCDRGGYLSLDSLLSETSASNEIHIAPIIAQRTTWSEALLKDTQIDHQADPDNREKGAERQENQNQSAEATEEQETLKNANDYPWQR